MIYWLCLLYVEHVMFNHYRIELLSVYWIGTFCTNIDAYSMHRHTQRGRGKDTCCFINGMAKRYQIRSALHLSMMLTAHSLVLTVYWVYTLYSLCTVYTHDFASIILEKQCTANTYIHQYARRKIILTFVHVAASFIRCNVWMQC